MHSEFLIQKWWLKRAWLIIFIIFTLDKWARKIPLKWNTRINRQLTWCNRRSKMISFHDGICVSKFMSRTYFLFYVSYGKLCWIFEPGNYVWEHLSNATKDEIFSIWDKNFHLSLIFSTCLSKLKFSGRAENLHIISPLSFVLISAIHF